MVDKFPFRFSKDFEALWNRPILTITSTLTLTTQETTGLLFIIMEILRKHYKTTPKIARIPINRGIKNGVVSNRDYTKHYTKGYTKPESDIDVAVIVPHVEGDWLTVSTDLWLDVDKVKVLIEPVLLEEGHHSPLYDDVMRTGVAV